MKMKNKALLFIGLVLCGVGLFFPIPGPADDPVDVIGMILVVFGLLKQFISPAKQVDTDSHKKIE